MKITTAEKHIISAYNKRTPAMLWGHPGIGKSAIIKQAAKKLGVDLIDLRLTQLEPTDLRGLPVPDPKTGRTKFYLPNFWPTSGKGILFFDEIEKASVSVKNAALEIMLDRRLGDYILPEGWSIIGAGNMEDSGAFSAGLGTALCNRMLHFNVEQDYQAWLAWAHQNDILDDILGYLAFRPDHLLKMSEDASNAFPSPRSWEMADRMLRGVEDSNEINELLEGSVGNAVGREFRVWQAVYRNVNVQDILVKGIIPSFDDKEKSFVYAVVMAVAHYVKKHKHFNEIADNTAKFLTSIGAEYRIALTKQFSYTQMIKILENKAMKGIGDELIRILLGVG